MAAAGERARHWPHPTAPGVDLLTARYIHHTFSRHVHPGFTIGAIIVGVEEFHHRGALERVGAGGLALVNPDTVHTGHAGIPEGWAYRALYPSEGTVQEVATGLGALPGALPRFTGAAVHDPATARVVLAAHRAAEGGDPLAADYLLHVAIARLLRRHSTFRPVTAPEADAAPRTVREAAAVLADRLVDPPALAELADLVGARPFTLLRGFRRVYGLPPHAWLVQRRVERARVLLDAGAAPADAAASAGFTDQAHLTRHFRRALGVGPGAYRRERQERTRTRDGNGRTLPA